MASSSEPVTLRSPLVTNLLALFLLLHVLGWNLTTVSEFRMPERLVPISHSLGIAQIWDMFAPYPAKDDGWYVIPGTLRGGQQVNLMAITRDEFGLREGVSWEKPRYVANIYKNSRWRNYHLRRIWVPYYNSDQLLYYSRYICREWNVRHAGAEQLTDFQVIYMREETLPDYQLSTPQEAVLWEHRCYGAPVRSPGGIRSAA